MFMLTIFDKEFAINHMNETNPFNELLMVDGLIFPLSSIQENLQELCRIKNL